MFLNCSTGEIKNVNFLGCLDKHSASANHVTHYTHHLYLLLILLVHQSADTAVVSLFKRSDWCDHMFETPEKYVMTTEIIHLSQFSSRCHPVVHLDHYKTPSKSSTWNLLLLILSWYALKMHPFLDFVAVIIRSKSQRVPFLVMSEVQ